MCTLRIIIIPMKTLRFFFISILALFTLLIGCVGEDEGFSVNLDDTEGLFGMPVGSIWKYVDVNGDTTYREYKGIVPINGEDLMEVEVTSSSVRKEYFSQINGKVFLHAIKQANFDAARLDYLGNDTLIVLDPPSINYVYQERDGFEWVKRQVNSTSFGFEEVVERMVVDGTERITTPAGSFECLVVRSDASTVHHVSQQGLVEESLQLALTDSTDSFLLIRRLVEIQKPN